MDRIKFGVISCASMARNHMKGITADERSELSYICDIDDAELEKAAELFPDAKRTKDYQDILNDPEIDAVVIAVPDQLHRQLSIEALNAGKHVLCEKPLALTMADCEAMILAANASDKNYMVGQIARYTPGFYQAKKMVDDGVIGELFYVESEYAHDYAKLVSPWRLDPLRHGFLGGACHAVDLLRWIAGNPTEVMAYSNHKMLPDYPTDDCTIAILKFPNNVIGKIFGSTGCKRSYTMRSLFYGTRGTIITDNKSNHMQLFRADENGEFDKRPEEIPVVAIDHNAAGEIRDFIDSIANRRQPSTPAWEGAATVAVSLAVIESTKTGLPVQVRYPNEKA